MPKKKTKKSKNYSSLFLIIPAVFFVLFMFLVIFDIYFKSQVLINTTKESPLVFTLSDYPILTANNPPLLSANGAVIMDSNTKKILFAKNPDVRFSPASTTKIMTALTALEYYKPDDILTVNSSDIDSTIGLRIGQKFRFIDLMYAMMLPSDNRAAATIADNFPGGRSAFVAKMNQNLTKWSLRNTYFADPVGLLDDSDYTTPQDLAILSSIAMENESIRKIANTKEIIITDIDNKQTFTLENLNRLLDFDGVVGLKTGHTDQAGDVLATAKMENGHLLIIVVMNSGDRFSDTLETLNFIKNKLTFLSIHP